MKGVVEDSFRLNLSIMKFIGLYPLDKCPGFYKCYSYTLYITALVPASILGFIKLFLRDDTNKGFDLISFSIVFLAPKIFLVLINGGNIQRCIMCFDKDIFVRQSQPHEDIIDACVKICRRNSNIFFSGCAAGMVSWCGKLFLSDHTQLPLDVWLPFKDSPLFYECLYCSLVLGGIYAGFACATIDPLVAGLICHASGQVQVLKENLKRLDKDFSHAVDNAIIKSALLYKRITQCIDHYNAIINFVEEYERGFSGTIFCQFMHSIVTICICCLQISKVEDFDIHFLIMPNYLFYLLLQIYFCCYYGTTLINENDTITDTVYMTDWYEYNEQHKKTLIILMERSKRPLTVTAGKILNLSLETFTLILKRSYSLLAVLKRYY